MSRQDQIVDDDESESCPLCIEELDLSDRGFLPCPCGYQICQFCYNHLKTQMNSLCPACRRPYDDKNIKFEAPSAEEVARYKENKAQQDKKKAAARRQEAATRHADTLSRKHLAGIRVRRQNLVYVTGLRLNTSDPQLSEKLRGEQFFGQYGKIDKIVVNKPKDSRSLQPVGVYITYFEKDAAALCIEMVNGTQNVGGQVRADYGTTKYCSAFLRNEICSNKNCTFLHEVGEDNESFTREGLSSLNAISSQSPPSQAPPPPTPSQQQAQAPPQQAPQPQSQPQPVFAPAPTPAQPMERQDSGNEPSSPVDSSDGSALPSTASWARESQSRRPSQSQSFASASPVVSNANPMPPVTESPAQEAHLEATSPQSLLPRTATEPIDPDVLKLRQTLASDGFQFVFDDSGLNYQDKELLNNLPLLFDPRGGAKRLVARRREDERRRQEKDQQVASQALSAMDVEDGAGGSLQLGGEPEDRQDLELHQPQQRAAVASPSFGLDRGLSPSNLPQGLTSRSPLPQQQQQFLAQNLKSNSPGLLGPGQRLQGEQYQPASGLAHSRQTSRFSFANDSASATTSVKPATNPKHMNQQSAMMPPSHSNQLNPLSQQSQGGSQFFSSGIQGPPPGLKATGTPPVSGGGMFGQGHGFATAGLGYGVNSTSRNTNDEMMRELLRNRGSSAGSGQTPDGGRRGVVDLADPSILQARMHQTGGASQGQYGAQGQGQDRPIFASATANTIRDDPFAGVFTGKSATFPRDRSEAPRGSTPTLPPGLSRYSSVTLNPPTEQLFGRAPPLTSEEPPPMPGLGVISAHAQVENATQPLIAPLNQNTVLPNRSSEVDKRTHQGVSVNEESSFPALPKATPAKPVVEAKKRGKQSADVRQNIESKKREAVLEKSTETVNQTVKDEKSAADVHHRQHPGKIEIPAAGRTITEPKREASSSSAPATSSKPGTPIQGLREQSSTPSTGSRPASPNQAPETPLRRATQPRTIRVLPTAKSESPAPPFTTSTPSSQAPPRPPSVGSKQPSRQPSIASLNAPGTPTHEKIPDNASVTTGSVSRASSPPPMTSETALERPKTKSRAKKERAEKAKAAAEETKAPDKDITPSTEAAAHEPITGRKKKSKKPTAPTTSTSTPELSRPPSPTPQPKQVEVVEQPQEESQPAAVAADVTAEIPKEIVDVPEEPAPAPKPLKPSGPVPASTVSQLELKGDIDSARLDFFKANTGLFNTRHDIMPSDLLKLQAPAPLTPEELQTLDAGDPIHRSGDDNRTASRLLITPSRKCLPRLTAEMEARYLELEKAIMGTKPPFKYTHKRKEAAQLPMTAEEILADMCATLTRPPTTTAAANVSANNAAAQAASEEATASSFTSASPGADASPPNAAPYGDDALAYLNQFILPPLPARGAPLADPTASPLPATSYTAAGEDDHLTAATSRLTANAAADKASLNALNSLGQNLSSLAGAGGDGAAGSAAITQALANAVNGVVQAAAAVTGVTVGSLGQAAAGGRTAPSASATAGLGGFMSSEEAEQALSAARKEVEALEKKMAGLVRRNRRLAGLQ